MRTSVVGSVILGFSMAASAADAIPNAGSLSAESGQATFAVRTNALGLDVKGKSDALRVNVDMHTASDGVVLDRVAAWLPVKTLTTGMTLRDEHMRKFVFDKPNGETPDLRFEAERISCAGLAPGREAACPVSGTLAIQGTPRKFSALLKVRQESASVFRIRGEGTVKLSDYGIEQPSQLGVKTANEVQVHMEFTARPAVSAAVHGAPQR